jgi:small redox-active disulfide protein 2
MKDIKVLGSGCANCKTTLKLIEEVAQARGVAVNLEKVEDMAAILGYGVMSTPGVVIDGKVVHAGGVPSRDKIAEWLAGSIGAPQAPPKSGGCCSGGNCG